MASLVAACQLDTALRAARAVISCEAELDAELRLRKARVARWRGGEVARWRGARRGCSKILWCILPRDVRT